MIGLWLWMSFALANACPTTADEVVSDLLNRGDVTAYRCMVGFPNAISELTVRIPEGTPQTTPRLQRALVFALLNEGDAPWNPERVSLLSPADRRILADGVKARRGRKSPAELHHRIFEQWEWYEPLSGYTDNLLTTVDRTNINMADEPGRFLKASPPESPKPPTASQPSAGCGCTSAPVFQFEVGLLVLLLSLGACRLRWS